MRREHDRRLGDRDACPRPAGGHIARGDGTISERERLRRGWLPRGRQPDQRSLPLPRAHDVQGHRAAADVDRYRGGDRGRRRRLERLHDAGDDLLLEPPALRQAQPGHGGPGGHDASLPHRRQGSGPRAQRRAAGDPARVRPTQRLGRPPPHPGLLRRSAARLARGGDGGDCARAEPRRPAPAHSHLVRAQERGDQRRRERHAPRRCSAGDRSLRRPAGDRSAGDLHRPRGDPSTKRRRGSARHRPEQPRHRPARVLAHRSGPLCRADHERRARPRDELAAVQGGARATRPRLLHRLLAHPLQRHRRPLHQRRCQPRAGGRDGEGDQAGADQARRGTGGRRGADEVARLHDRQLPPRAGDAHGARAAGRRAAPDGR